MKALGNKINGSQQKIRLKLGGGLQSNWEEIVKEFEIGSWSVGDNLFNQLENIEIDIWVDTETGNITVDGAW